MPYYDRRRIAPGQFLVLLICLFLSCYFAYHTFKGKHGLEARISLDQQVLDLEQRLTGLEVMRARMERDIALMSDDTLDLDMLDEQAREVLDFSHPRDRIYLKVN